MSTKDVRVEHDLLGERDVPSEAYWGIHTLRALENFPISATPISHYPQLVNALCAVKQAAAKANCDLGILDQDRADAIITACIEIRAGGLHEFFCVDAIQGGAGTSTNMNVNEVVANRGLELLGHARGEYQHLHPLDHVNLSQSTNDAYPTALSVAVHEAIGDLVTAMRALKAAFEAKAEEFSSIIKMGRTQLQDAVPMTLGQEFKAFAVMLGEDIDRLSEARSLLLEVNLGGTAIGTGINTNRRYSPLAIGYLAEITGEAFIPAENLIEATQDVGAFVQISGVLKRVAVKLSKTANDLRLLSSGPRAGFGEINLPARQAGSSIMPGKVNPVIPEVVNQVAFEVIGNDVTITMAAEGGQLQLNAFEPIIAYSLFRSIGHLTQACETLRERCVVDITANADHLADLVKHSIGLVTALSPTIGYEKATQVAQRALAENQSVVDVVLDLGLLSQDQLDELLEPVRLTHPEE